MEYVDDQNHGCVAPLPSRHTTRGARCQGNCHCSSVCMSATCDCTHVLRSCVALWAPYDSFYRINTNLTTMHAQFVSLDAELNEKVLDEFWIHRTPAQQ